ncbi:MAG: hypothetical protein LUG23_00125 [Oscillospiraceae bacterium]|nr:hypothetical protein [Oscillospiraceae bacterium]
MKSSCKQIDITDVNTILPWAGECIDRHKKRHDFEKLLLTVGGMTKENYRKAVNGDLSLLEEPKRRIAEEAAKRIKERNLKLAPVVIQYRRDKSSLKLRQIGRESAMQQIFDYIAIRSCEDIWNRRIVPQQASSIRNRGQVYGIAMISSWVQKDNRAAEYAKEHGYRYSRKCKEHVKLDVKQCYPSLRTEMFMRRFRRDCKNKDILWLWETLLNSHKVNGYEGFMIGALISQQAAQYLLSFVYRYAMTLTKTRRDKKIKLITHGLFFMDDMLFTGSSRSSLKQAVRKIEAYVKAEIGVDIKPLWQIQELDKTPIDMMGYLVRADGTVSIRPRVFIRSRRTAQRSNRHGMSLRQARRLSAFKGYYKQKKKTLKFRNYKIMYKLNLYKLFKKAGEIVSINERMNANVTVDTVHGKAGGNAVYAVA